MLGKEIDEKLAYLKQLIYNPNRDVGTILSIFYDLFQQTHEGRDLSPKDAEWLKITACLFLSPELLGILVKLRLDVYGFTFAALLFTEVDDVIDDLSNNGEILKGIHSLPPGAVIKLKRELLINRRNSKMDKGSAPETKELESNHHYLPEKLKEQQCSLEENPSSLMLTYKEKALEERKRINVTIEELTLKIHIKLTKMEELRKTKQMIENYSDEINANKDFKYDVNISKGKKIEITDGKCTTNCSKCSMTCHFPCTLAMTADKLKCAAMGKDGLCKSCPLKCKWDLHLNQNFRWIFQEVKETKTYEEILKKYGDAVQEKLTTEEVAQALEREFEQIKYDLKSDIDTITACLRHLDQMALSPVSFTTTDYIELMIQAQMKEKKSGFQERIKSLNSLLVKARVVQDIFPEAETAAGQSCAQLIVTAQPKAAMKKPKIRSLGGNKSGSYSGKK